MKIQNDLLKKENELLSELKSQNDSLRKEKEELLLKDFSSNDLKKENDDLRKQVEDLTKTLVKFTLGEQNLNMLLGKQRCIFDKVGLGFNPTFKENKYNNFFSKTTSTSSSNAQMRNSHQSIFVKVSSSSNFNPRVTFYYCLRKGNVNYKCPNRRNINMV